MNFQLWKYLHIKYAKLSSVFISILSGCDCIGIESGRGNNYENIKREKRRLIW